MDDQVKQQQQQQEEIIEKWQNSINETEFNRNQFMHFPVINPSLNSVVDVDADSQQDKDHLNQDLYHNQLYKYQYYRNNDISRSSSRISTSTNPLNSLNVLNTTAVAADPSFSAGKSRGEGYGRSHTSFATSPALAGSAGLELSYSPNRVRQQTILSPDLSLKSSSFPLSPTSASYSSLPMSPLPLASANHHTAPQHQQQERHDDLYESRAFKSHYTHQQYQNHSLSNYSSPQYHHNHHQSAYYKTSNPLGYQHSISLTNTTTNTNDDEERPSVFDEEFLENDHSVIPPPSLQQQQQERKSGLEQTSRYSGAGGGDKYDYYKTRKDSTSKGPDSVGAPALQSKPSTGAFKSPLASTATTDLEDEDISMIKKSKKLKRKLKSQDGTARRVEFDAMQSKDWKLPGYTVLFTITTFIAFHILPLIDWFPVLLRSRMGPTTSTCSLFILAGSIGYHVASSRSSYLHSYTLLKKHRSFYSARKLVLFLLSLYCSSFVTSWIFWSLWIIKERVPIFGSMIALWTVLFSALCVWMGAVVVSIQVVSNATHFLYRSHDPSNVKFHMTNADPPPISQKKKK